MSGKASKQQPRKAKEEEKPKPKPKEEHAAQTGKGKGKGKDKGQGQAGEAREEAWEEEEVFMLIMRDENSKVLWGESLLREREVEALQAQLAGLHADLAPLQAAIADQDAELLSLSNQLLQLQPKPDPKQLPKPPSPRKKLLSEEEERAQMARLGAEFASRREGEAASTAQRLQRLHALATKAEREEALARAPKDLGKGVGKGKGKGKGTGKGKAPRVMAVAELKRQIAEARRRREEIDHKGPKLSALLQALVLQNDELQRKIKHLHLTAGKEEAELAALQAKPSSTATVSSSS